MILLCALKCQIRVTLIYKIIRDEKSMLLSEFSVQDQEVLQSNYIAVTIRYTQVVKVLLIFCMFWTYLYTTII